MTRGHAHQRVRFDFLSSAWRDERVAIRPNDCRSVPDMEQYVLKARTLSTNVNEVFWSRLTFGNNTSEGGLPIRESSKLGGAG